MMTRSRRLLRLAPNKGAALIIVLAFVVLLTGLVLAYFSRSATDRQVAQSSFNDTDAYLLARSALDIVIGDFKQEIVNGSTSASIPGVYYVPWTKANGYLVDAVVPVRRGTSSTIPNLIRPSIRNDTGIWANWISSSASAVNSTTDPSANGRSISRAQWNSHYLIPRDPSATGDDSTPINTFVAPDWVIVTRNGPSVEPGIGSGATALNNPASTNTNYAVGRYAYAVYDEGGLLDINVAGFPTQGSNPAGWGWNIGRKGVLAFADLTALPMTTAAINTIVGFRNYATMGLSSSGLNFSFSAGAAGNFSTYFLGPVGVSPWVSPSDHVGTGQDFGAVNLTKTGSGTSSRTDQSFITRGELIKLRRSANIASVDTLQYLGTFSREKNASTWRAGGTTTGQIEAHLAAPPAGHGRFYIGLLNTVVPAPASPSNFQNALGLKWQPHTGGGKSVTPGWWFYNGPTNPTALAHIPPFAGNAKHEFFKLLEYAMFGNDDGNDGGSTQEFVTTLSVGASLIDQYDPLVGVTLQYSDTGDSTGSYTTAIKTSNSSGLWAFGMEKSDPNLAVLTTLAAPAPVPTPAGAMIFVGANTSDPNDANGSGRPLRGVGDFSYGVKTNLYNSSTGTYPTLDFITWPQAQNAPWGDTPVLDFFSYSNPYQTNVTNGFATAAAPIRSGVVSLNTRQPRVLAALLSGTLVHETTNTTVTGADAIDAANTIVNAAATTPALSRADIVRLASGVINGSFPAYNGTRFTKEAREAIPRALAECVQTRTWGLLIDLVAQTGHYSPNAQGLGDFIVEGEKRYWLHIAIDRFDGTVLDQQLEEALQ